jgi:hypothetical protein
METFLIVAAVFFIGIVILASIQQANRKRAEGGQSFSSTAEHRREIQNIRMYPPPEREK